MNKRETKKLINRLARIAVAVGWKVDPWVFGEVRFFQWETGEFRYQEVDVAHGQGVVEVTHRLKCAVLLHCVNKPDLAGYGRLLRYTDGYDLDSFDVTEPLSECDALSRVMAEIVGVRV